MNCTSHFESPLVAIRCITYNHELYIRDALEGFVMQKTNFPFVAIVHDDASTDGTAAIIREYADKYPDIIKPIYETENQYSKRDGSLGRIMNAAIEATGAKYIAMCEGDDYWTDPLKLQKQVDFLESHPDYGMCYTKVRRFNQSKKKFADEWGGPNETFEELLAGNTIPTPTVVLRHDIQVKYYDEINPSKHNWLMGDYPMWLYVAVTSKIKFVSENTGVYRIICGSASHSISIIKKLEFVLSYYEIGFYFEQIFNLKQNRRNRCTYNWVRFQYDYIKNNGLPYISSLKYIFQTKGLKRKTFIIASCILPFKTMSKIVHKNIITKV